MCHHHPTLWKDDGALPGRDRAGQHLRGDSPAWREWAQRMFVGRTVLHTRSLHHLYPAELRSNWMNEFIFNDDVNAVHKFEIPRDINSDEELLGALSVALRFPAYFGKNWNALDECICDLSWLPPGDVVLIHEDLPLAGSRVPLSIYLSILRDAARNWETKGSNLIYTCPEKWDATGERALLVRREFLVVFPSNAESVVRSILTESKSS